MFSPMIATLLVFSGLLPLLESPRAADESPTMESAWRLIERDRYEQAEAAYRKIVALDESNGQAWFLLGYCLQLRDQDQAAIEAHLKSLANDGPKDFVHYNLACAFEGTGKLELASEHLSKSIAEGYLDFDSMMEDSDLKQTLAGGKVELPKLHEFPEHKARNGVRMPYELVLPKNYDSERAYPAFVLFAPGAGPLAASWAWNELCGGEIAEQDSLILLVGAPDRGWYTHPTHHALEDLLKHVRKQHSIVDDRYHLVGFAGGSNPARTYAGMSGRYFESFSIIGGRPYENRDERDILDHKSLRLSFLLGTGDPAALAQAKRVSALLKAKGGSVRIQAVDDALGSYPSLHGGRWVSAVRQGLGFED